MKSAVAFSLALLCASGAAVAAQHVVPPAQFAGAWAQGPAVVVDLRPGAVKPVLPGCCWHMKAADLIPVARWAQSVGVPVLVVDNAQNAAIDADRLAKAGIRQYTVLKGGARSYRLAMRFG